MGLKLRRGTISLLIVLLALPRALAQGRLEDYQRAERFLPGNLRHLVSPADTTPPWIEKTNRFWYRRESPTGVEFNLVDPEHSTSGPAFDHTRLAEALSKRTKQQYSASTLPFSDFEFSDVGTAIRFAIDNAQWTCQLAAYDCQKDPPGPEKPNETLSPNKRWAAYVNDHNLYVRDVSTGATLQLTHDGVPGWDYATPLPSLRLMVEQPPVGCNCDLTNSLGRPIAILRVGLNCPSLLQNFLQGLPSVENMVPQQCASRRDVSVAAQFQNLMMFLVSALDSVRQIQLQASIPFAAVIDVSDNRHKPRKDRARVQSGMEVPVQASPRGDMILSPQLADVLPQDGGCFSEVLLGQMRN